jgi:uncharacterized protein
MGRVHYEWDPRKATSNQRKHGIDFEEATTVFLDPLALTYSDPDHSQDETRFITVGLSSRGRLVMVAHLEVGEEQIRIFSARPATKRESHAYEETT